METETQPTTIGLGSYLRGEREKRHITIEQVASATKINIKLLHALENDNYNELPAKPFVRGFVMSYARYLSLDSNEILTRFESYLTEKGGVKYNRPANAPHIFVGKEPSTDNSKTVLSVFMIGFLVVAVVAFFVLKPTLKHRRHKVERQKAVGNEEIYTVNPPPEIGEGAPLINSPIAAKEETPALDPTPAPTPTPAPSAQQAQKPPVKESVTQPQQPAKIAEKEKPKSVEKISDTKMAQTSAGGGTSTTTDEGQPIINVKWPNIPNDEAKLVLAVRALKDSWIKYQADDFSLRQYTLKAGQKIYVRGRSSIRFRCFMGDGVEISLNGAEFKPLTTTLTQIIPGSAAQQYKDNPFILYTTKTYPHPMPDLSTQSN